MSASWIDTRLALLATLPSPNPRKPLPCEKFDFYPIPLTNIFGQDAFQLYDLRKQYIRASMDYTAKAIKFKATLDTSIADQARSNFSLFRL